MSDSEQPTPTAPRGRFRRLLGLLVRGPLGCLSFLLGAGVVLLAVTPLIVSRLGPGVVEEDFEATFEGSLDVERFDLGWFERQALGAVTLEDPDGGDVARGTLSFPSLVDLARGGGTEFGRVRLAADFVALERDAEGRWNLARALAPRAARRDGARREIAREGDGSDGGPLARLADRRAQLELRVDRFTVADRGEGGPDEPLVVEGFDLALALAPGSATVLQGGGRITAPEASDIAIAGLLTSGAALAEPLPVRELRVRVDRVSVDWLDRFLRQDGRLVALVGGVALAELDARRRESGGDELLVRLDLTGARTVATVHLAVEDGHLVVDEERVSQVRLLDPSGLAEGYVGALLPEHLALRSTAETLTIDLERLSWPLPPALGGPPPAASGRAGAGGLGLEATAALGGWVLETSGGPLGLDDAQLSVRLDPATGLAASLVAATAGGGALTLDVTTAPLAALAADVELGRAPAVDVALGLADVPTAPVDAALGADGLFDALLGGSLSATVTLAPAGREDVWAADVRASSPLCDLDLAGEIVEGRLIGASDRPLATAFELTPLSSPRVVGNLLPLLAVAEKPPGAERARLTLSDFTLPLDGDLAGLSGELWLDLGVVTARWLPELAAGVGQTLEPIELDPVVVHIAGGRAEHEPFELTIRGLRVPLSGGVDLSTGEARFDARVPAKLLGGELGQIADALQGGLAEDLALPVSIRGQWPRLSFAVDTAALEGSARELLEDRLGEELDRRAGEALDKALEDAVGEELSGQLQGLLRSLRKDG